MAARQLRVAGVPAADASQCTTELHGGAEVLTLTGLPTVVNPRMTPTRTYAYARMHVTGTHTFVRCAAHSYPHGGGTKHAKTKVLQQRLLRVLGHGGLWARLFFALLSLGGVHSLRTSADDSDTLPKQLGANKGVPLCVVKAAWRQVTKQQVRLKPCCPRPLLAAPAVKHKQHLLSTDTSAAHAKPRICVGSLRQ